MRDISSVSEILLYEFPHSHFCEVARWALDHKKLRYRSIPVLPGYHLHKIKKIAPNSHVPVLVDDGIVVQGSQAILDYLDREYPYDALRSNVDLPIQHKIENEIASKIGVPLRRLCYANLLSRPELVRYFFMHRSNWFENLIFRLSYPALHKRIQSGYDCTEAGAQSAKSELSAAFDYYDKLLDGRPYLQGEHFTRLDLTLASLAVFLIMPKQYPVAWPNALAIHELGRWFRTFAQRPTYRHVQAMYENHRHTAS